MPIFLKDKLPASGKVEVSLASVPKLLPMRSKVSVTEMWGNTSNNQPR